MEPTTSRTFFTVSVTYDPSMALIACSGHATLVEVCSVLQFGGEIARRSQRQLFLFDWLSVDFEGSEADREEMGRVGAELLRGVRRVAVVVPAAMYTGVGERVARDAGLELRNFQGLAAAIEWLKS